MGGARDARPPLGPISFFNFHAVFGINLVKYYVFVPSSGVDSPLLGNPGSATE